MPSIFAESLLPSAVSLVVDASWKALLLLLIATLAAFCSEAEFGRHAASNLVPGVFGPALFANLLCGRSALACAPAAPAARRRPHRRRSRTGRSPADVVMSEICRRRPDRWVAARNGCPSRTGRNGSTFENRSTLECAGRGAGCHAHGSAWACLRTSNGFARPRKAVGVAPTILGQPVCSGLQDEHADPMVAAQPLVSDRARSDRSARTREREGLAIGGSMSPALRRPLEQALVRNCGSACACGSR